jgi:hypothetical protein
MSNGPSAGDGDRLAIVLARIEAAAGRVEAAARRRADPDHGSGIAAVERERDVLARDCELLRAECDDLRRALEAAEARAARLDEAAAAVGLRLDRTVAELRETLGG